MRKLNIWLLTDGENLPLTPGVKKNRTWMLGEYLSQRGHNIVWWSSNFAHMHKEKICEGDLKYNISKNFDMMLLDCGTYKKNISFSRFLHHRTLGKKFYKQAIKCSAPDIIVCSHPTIDFSKNAIKVGKYFNVPVIIDIRDMWPDIFSDYFDGLFKWPVKILVALLNIKTKNAFKKANAIVSMSTDLLEWGVLKSGNGNDSNFKTGVFYLGYDESSSNIVETAIPEVEKLIGKKTIFSYLGILGESYDIQSIIDAARIIKSKGVESCHFIIAGDGPKREKIENEISSLDNITYVGWLNKPQSHYLMKNTDVSIIPNLCTAIPNKVFEALYFGKFIFFTMDGEAKKILEKNKLGLYYDKNNKSAEELSKLVIKTSENPKLLNDSKLKTRDYYDKNLKCEAIYTKYCEFIEETNNNFIN